MFNAGVSPRPVV